MQENIIVKGARANNLKNIDPGTFYKDIFLHTVAYCACFLS